jgi:SAM-dependent methyltransferase
MEDRPPNAASRPAARLEGCAFPLQLELETVARVLGHLLSGNQACLGVGFASPVACRRLRACGGYWHAVAADRETCDRLAAALGEEVALSTPQDLLPFEDKQFDIVVLARGALTGDRAADTALVRECHRVLKVSGCLVLTVEYAKTFGLAQLLQPRALSRARGGGQYTEAGLFDLLKTGFDWLGLRTYCRFWVQLVRQWVGRQPDAADSPLLAALYWAARAGDCLLFFTRGYLVTAYGRRKGWRPRQTPKLADGRSISEAVLQKPGR